jgi:hypothetical protein
MLGQHLILVAIMIFEKRRESSWRKKKVINGESATRGFQCRHKNHYLVDEVYLIRHSNTLSALHQPVFPARLS